MLSELVAAAVTTARHIEAELNEDFVGLWEIPWELSKSLPQATEREIRSLTEGVLKGFDYSSISIGQMSGPGDQFEPWEDATAVSRAMRAWDELERRPTIGEIAWLARRVQDI